MNSVTVIGRLTRDPQMSYTTSQMAIARFTVAIDRGKDKNGESKGADFPSVVCFGKTAELCEKYISKGRLVGISGRLQTGSYEKDDGQKVYTTDIVADRVDFLDRGDSRPIDANEVKAKPSQYEGFSTLSEDDIPF